MFTLCFYDFSNMFIQTIMYIHVGFYSSCLLIVLFQVLVNTILNFLLITFNLSNHTGYCLVITIWNYNCSMTQIQNALTQVQTQYIWMKYHPHINVIHTKIGTRTKCFAIMTSHDKL